jgi:hypothetical protein
MTDFLYAIALLRASVCGEIPIHSSTHKGVL